MSAADDSKGEKQQDALLKSLDPSFFTEKCSPLGIMWKTLPRYYTDETLAKELQKYQSALDIIELRLSRKVMSSYGQFVGAMNDVQQLGEDLHKSMTMCRSSKESMASARSLLAVNGMTIVALYKRRQKQVAAITLMVKLRRFLRLREEMNEKAKIGEFGTAFLLCMQIRDLYKDLATLKCMRNLAIALKNDVDDLRAKVDRALGTMSRTNFNGETYKSILSAMILMHGGKTPKILESHTVHFKNSVEAASKRAIITTLLLEPDMFSPDELERLKLVTLCRRLTETHFPMCLNLMFEQFCNYLFTFHAMTVWLVSNAPSVESDEKSARIYQQLHDGLMKHKRVLWEQQMQESITLMLGALKIDQLNIKTFLETLDSLSKFIAIAEEFTGTMAHSLRETFREHSKVYFTQFHRTKIEQVKELFEKESWNPMPLAKGYYIKNFKELNELVVSTMPQQRAYKRRKQSFFDGYSVQGNPFASVTEGMDMEEEYGSKKKQLTRYKWEEAGPELMVDFVDELGNTSTTGQNNATKKATPVNTTISQRRNSTNSQYVNPITAGGPIISSLTHQIVEFIGEYLRLMQILPHLTSVIFDGLIQLVEYFIFSIHNSFGTCKPALSNGDRNLGITLRRIQTSFILDQSTADALLSAAANQLAAQTSSSGIFSGLKDTFSLGKDSVATTNGPNQTNPSLPAGTLTPGGVFVKANMSSPTDIRVTKAYVPFNNAPLQQQISQVVVAAGSLRFLRQILADLQPNMIELLGKDKLPKVISFAGSLAETTVPLRKTIFKYLLQHCVNPEKYIASIAAGRWDTLDEDVRESAYTKPLIKDVASYVDKLKQMVKQQSLPADMLPEMVLQALQFVMELCVEGFSKARRVTLEGHNVMLYDTQELKSNLEKLAGIRNHDWSFMDEYVHAYHFPCDDLLVFFNEHPWYTKSQLTGLVSSGLWNQKEKTRLLDALNYHGAITASADSSRSQSTSTNKSRSSSRR